MKIFITGCAKSGTTLVRRLFNAFDLKVFNDREMNLQKFIKQKEYHVAKRSSIDIFSNSMTYADLQRQVNYILSNNITVVNVVRNKEDVLKSSGGYVSDKRYTACMDQVQIRGNHIAFTIHYEDLIGDPDKVQRELAEALGLTIIHKWSDYPKFIKHNEKVIHENNKLRPIGAPKK